MDLKNTESLISPILTVIAAAIAIIAAIADAVGKWIDINKKIRDEQKENPDQVAFKSRIKILSPVLFHSVALLLVILLTFASVYRYQKALMSDRLVIIANKEIQAGNTEDAEKLLSDAQENDSSNLMILMAKADIARRREDYNGAAELYKVLIKLSPSFSLAYRKLAYVYAQDADKASRSTNEIDKYTLATDKYTLANKAIENFLLLQPESPSGVYQHGVICLELSRYSDARLSPKTMSGAESELIRCAIKPREWSDWAYYNLAKLSILKARVDNDEAERAKFVKDAFDYLNKAYDKSKSVYSDSSVGKVGENILRAKERKGESYEDFAPTKEDKVFAERIFQDKRYSVLIARIKDEEKKY